MGSLQMDDDDDEISNCVDLYMYMLGGGWKWQDLQGLLWWIIIEEEPKRISKALQDDSWVQAMQEELLLFKLQQVWVLVDLPHGMKVIGTKWVYRNKKDERGVVVRNKARLVAQGHRREEGIDYDKVFAPVAMIEAIRWSKIYMDFIKPHRVGMLTLSTISRRAWIQKGYPDKTLFYKKTRRISGCSSVNLKVLHLLAMKRIFKYLKSKPNLGFWYPRESPFDLEAFSDSDYGVSNLDRKSITDERKVFVFQTVLAECYCHSLDDGTLEIKATIDTIEYTITEPSIRSKLQLADASGITMLPNDEIFEGMGHMGGFRRVSRPLLPAMLSIANPSAGQEPPSVTQPQPSSSVVPPTPPSTQPIPSKATAIPPFSQPAPPTPIAEATNASPSPTPSPAHLMARIDNLEKQLKETKQTFRKAILTLVERGRKFHDLDPLVSLLQELVTPSKTINASGEEQVENISPTTLEAAAILTKVKKIKSVDKGNRYKRRKSSKEFAGTGLDFEEVKSAFEEVNTGGIKVSAGIKEINADSLNVNTGSDLVTIDSIRASVPSPDRGRREGKAPMTEEEDTQASKKTKAKQVRFGFTYKLKGC
ncbi:putative ribonuclease H-like domain-containing protein [Tanacetum coccineum]|uniref:Ribonuclease H-like domain-containing protein n=1 Tax=Tanacetum coccineum TaxID=301880 RepID=A0ABQ5GRU9_9ASTR